MEGELDDLLGHLHECLEDLPDLVLTSLRDLETVSDPPVLLESAAVPTPLSQDNNSAPVTIAQRADPLQASVGQAATEGTQGTATCSQGQVLRHNDIGLPPQRSALLRTNSTARAASDVSTASQLQHTQAWSSGPSQTNNQASSRNDVVQEALVARQTALQRTVSASEATQTWLPYQPQGTLARTVSAPASRLLDAPLHPPMAMGHAGQTPSSQQQLASPWLGRAGGAAGSGTLQPDVVAQTPPTAGLLSRRRSALDEMPGMQLDGTPECRQPVTATPSEMLPLPQLLDWSSLDAAPDMQLHSTPACHNSALQPPSIRQHAHAQVAHQGPGWGQQLQWQTGSGPSVQQQCSTPTGSRSGWEEASTSIAGRVIPQPARGMHSMPTSHTLSMPQVEGAQVGAWLQAPSGGLQTQGSMLDSLQGVGLDGPPLCDQLNTPHRGGLSTGANAGTQGGSQQTQQAMPGACPAPATAGTPMGQQQRLSILDSLPGVGLDGTPVVAHVTTAMPGSLSTTAHTGQAPRGGLQTQQSLLDQLPDLGVPDTPLASGPAALQQDPLQARTLRGSAGKTLPLAKELFPVLRQDEQECTVAGRRPPQRDPPAEALPPWCTLGVDMDELELCGMSHVQHTAEMTGNQAGPVSQQPPSLPVPHTAHGQTPPPRSSVPAQSPQQRLPPAGHLPGGVGARPARSASASRQLLRGGIGARPEEAGIGRGEGRPSLAPLQEDAAVTSSSKQSFSGQKPGEGSKAPCPEQQAEAGQESCVHTASSSKREASSRDRKVILQLRPRDTAMREAMSNARLNPQLELTCGAKKEVMAVVSHLQTRWAASSPPGQHRMELFPPESLPALAGLSWGVPSLHKTLTVLDLHLVMGCPDMLSLSYTWIPTAESPESQAHPESRAHPQAQPAPDIPFAVKARSLVPPTLPVSRPTRRVSKAKATSAGKDPGIASQQKQTQQQQAQAGEAGSSAGTAKGVHREREGKGAASAGPQTRTAAAETPTERMQAAQMKDAEVKPASKFVAEQGGPEGLAAGQPMKEARAAKTPAKSAQKSSATQQRRKLLSGKLAGEQRLQLVEVQSQQDRPAAAKRGKAASAATNGGGAGDCIKSPDRKRSRKHNGENMSPRQAADRDHLPRSQALALAQPVKATKSMAAQPSSSPGALPRTPASVLRGLQRRSMCDAGTESEDEYQPDKGLQLLPGRRPTTRSRAGGPAIAPCLNPADKTEAQGAATQGQAGVRGGDFQVDLRISEGAASEETTCDGFEGWAAFSRETMGRREAKPVAGAGPAAAGTSPGAWGLKDVSLSAWTAGECALARPQKQQELDGKENAQPAGPHMIPNGGELADLDIPLEFEDFLSSSFPLDFDPEEGSAEFSVAGSKPFQDMFIA